MSLDVSPETQTDTTSSDVTTEPESAPGMGGTSTEESALAGQDVEDGMVIEVPEDVESEGAEGGTGEEPEAPEGEEKPEPEPDITGKLTRRYVEELEQSARDGDLISRVLNADPERVRAFEAWVRQDAGQTGDTSDSLAGIDEIVEQRFPRAEDRDAVKAFVNPLREEIRNLRRELREIKPVAEQSRRVIASNEFTRSVETAGVPRDVQATPAFQKFLAREMKDREFARDRAKRPAYAGKNLARAWRAEYGRQETAAATRKRAADIKGGSLHAGVATSPNGHSKVFTVDTSKPGYDERVLAARAAAAARGEVLQVKYVRPE